MKLAAVQLNSQTEVTDNLTTVETLLGQVDLTDVGLIALPECFAAMTLTESDKMALASPAIVAEITGRIAQLANQYQSYINAGTIYVLAKGSTKYRARSLLFNPKGQIVSHYDKIHLFDVDLINNESYRESDYTEAGLDVARYDCGTFKLGFSVCYDLRFPELYQQLMQHQVDLICVPSAFTYQTGAVHWQTLLRARAIETQSYIVAANQTGVHANGRRTYGHSMIIDPWGEVIAQAAEQETVLIANFDRQLIQQVRRRIPLAKHKRLI